ncbi:MAG: hypothetical protein M0P61_06020 [Ignavibacteriaceae bacterium]|jgi:hypothetical protein|nr:hypothetical protein [Ignavibacteriaceae bacterium]
MQQLLIIGALIILGSLVLTFNRSTQNVNANNLFNIALIDATASAQSLIEGIQTKAFDEKTVSTNVSSASELTTTGSLGPDVGETVTTQFDDIDDYKNYTEIDSFKQFGAFSLSVEVNYVQKYSPETVSSTPTFLKKVDVTVTNPFLVHSLTLSRIISY